MMRRLLALLILLAAPAWAATYYVKNGGSDAASGLSDALAWETIAKVNGSSFNAGDSILFKRDSTWHEQLTAPSSGSSGLPITFGAYGTGADPIISGADDITAETWTQASPEEILTDGGIEEWNDANTPTHWSVTSSGNVVLQDAVHVHGGTYAVDSATTAGWVRIHEDVTLAASTQYTLKFWNYAASGDTSRLLISCLVSGDYYNYGWTSGSSWSAGDQYITVGPYVSYTEVTKTFTTPAAAGTYRIRFHWGNAGEAYLDDVSLLATASPPIYYSTVLSADPNVVWFDDVSYHEAASAAAVNSTNRWFWSNGDTRLYVYATSSPNGFYSDIEAPVRDYALNPWPESYLAHDGIHFKYGRLSTVKLDPPGTGLTLRNCSMTGDGSGAALWINADNTIVEDCAITGENRDGVNTLKIGSHDQYTDGVQVRRCVLRNGHHTLMSSFNARNFVIEYNDIKNEDDKWGRCFQFDDDGTHGGNIFRYNRVEGSYIGGEGGATGGNTISGINNAIYGNVFLGGNSRGLQIHAHSIEDVAMPTVNIKVYNNTFYDCPEEGIRLEDHGNTTSGNLIKNNIVANCGTANTQGSANNLAVDILSDSTPSAYTFQNNVFYLSTTTSTIYDGTTTRTVAYMEANDPTHWSGNIVSDPLFTNAAGGDFTLAAGSPCIDAGVDLGSTYQTALMPASSWPASVLTASQYNAGQKFECGAYLFPNKRQSLIIVGK